MLPRLFQLLPRRMQLSLYVRFLAKHRIWHQQRFDAAPLKLAPAMLMRLSPTDLFHGQIALMGIYEDELSHFLQSLSRAPGGFMIDVGANYGYFSLLWCAGQPDNRVHAVEASPVNLAPLRHNIAMNHLSERIVLHDWAASNKEGMVAFDLGSPEETGWGGLALQETSKTVPVSAHRLDLMFPGEDIELLKIDCEGADALVLEGAEALLSAGRIKHVVFEENLPRQQELGIKEGQSVKWLEKFGYSCRRLDKDPWIKSFQATRQR
jgi:FkbM family methyltransferase